MDVFINSAEAITPQNTFETNNILQEIVVPEEQYFSCVKPNYKEIINPKQLRRMSKVVRMGVASSLKALQNASVEQPDAIIVGTGLGCLDDTIKFLDQLIEQDEALLNPTAFIQSTHNTVSGQIALLLGCKNYNFTFSQKEVSFETALIDGLLMLQENEANNILVGGIDEMTEKTYLQLKKAGCTKDYSDDILNSATKGYVPGEGSCFFTLSNKTSDKNIVKVKDVSVFNNGDIDEVLAKNDLSINDIDVLITGVNGDIVSDRNYMTVKNACKESIQVSYKNIVGEFDTASSFATWLGARIIQEQKVPDSIQINAIKRKSINNVLIHNYSKGHGNSFILLSACK